MPPTPPTPTPTPGTPKPAFSFHHNRPAIPSPLSSSPIRTASSPPAPYQQQEQQQQQQYHYYPLSPCRFQRGTTQSSPIFPSSNSDSNNISSSSSSKFRFATRNPRPNPALKRREDAQECRRRLFLQNVRHRADEKRWERRGGEDEMLKLEWWRLNRERERLLAGDPDACFFWSVDEVEALEEEQGKDERMRGMGCDADMDVDALMVDDMEQHEEAEVEALVSVLEGRGKMSSSPHFSDDEDYDGLFMDLISQQQQQQWQLPGGGVSNHSQDVEMS
ncbi:hypothetical protein MFIFM68171_05354 [Madurella fahalii]|uniref:Uncharacterized protein n=1 Tax=Madurella fahalii TaxID=1157608 RepID=A0ABQ0GBJ9_9PEZI